MALARPLTSFLLQFLLPLTLALNLYLYYYPLLLACDFPHTPADAPAPFRLLAVADPQLEGDTSLRRFLPREREQPPTLLERYEDAVRAIKYQAKRLDLWGNDRYLKHIYKTMKRHTDPTHITVLGDLLGSQWIGDDEFARRTDRFWAIFDDAEKITADDLKRETADDDTWKHKLLLMPGNHDIGYAGDMNRDRLERFERAFGPVNYMLHYHPPAPRDLRDGEEAPELRLAVLNSLALDTPAWDPTILDESYAAIDVVLRNKSLSAAQATLLLTHLPFYKPAGLCADAPFIEYFPPENGAGVRTQNFLSEVVSNLLKGWIFGFPSGDEMEVKGKSRGLVLTGHDHEGCDTVHYWNFTEEAGSKHGRWAVAGKEKWAGMKGLVEEWEKSEEDKVETIREVTVRSVMGMYGGNVGLVAGWYDWDTEEWKFDVDNCSFGVQHVWWTVHVTSIIAAIYSVGLALLYVFEKDEISQATSQEEKKRK